MNQRVTTENRLGTYLRDRRLKLDPSSFGFSAGRRRTKGLRREEVASRANISPTWYTWLEQGRGGAPSADVLDRMVPKDAERIPLAHRIAGCRRGSSFGSEIRRGRRHAGVKRDVAIASQDINPSLRHQPITFCRSMVS